MRGKSRISVKSRDHGLFSNLRGTGQRLKILFIAPSCTRPGWCTLPFNCGLNLDPHPPINQGHRVPHAYFSQNGNKRNKWALCSQDRDYAIAALEIRHPQRCALISLFHLAVCILFMLVLAQSREGSAKQNLHAFLS